ncbi:hypothetical protein P4129_18835 [Pseudomonas aeruginosa]|nr:hypothetical protein [Pseudomonas aeruginosa]
MWQTPQQRIALLELLVQGTLKRRASQVKAYDTLAELSWIRSTGRRDQIALVEARRTELVALLERVWPDWQEALAALTAGGFSPRLMVGLAWKMRAAQGGFRRCQDVSIAGLQPR